MACDRGGLNRKSISDWEALIFPDDLEQVRHDLQRTMAEGIADVKAVDIAMPTRQGTVIRNRCMAQPTESQAVLLQRLGLHLPQRMKIHKM